MTSPYTPRPAAGRAGTGRSRRAFAGLLLAGWFSLITAGSAPAAGVTIVTHGLNGSVDDWVIPMTQRMARYPGFPGTNYTCYLLSVAFTNNAYVTTATRLVGPPPGQLDSGEIFVKLDWRSLANNSHSTTNVAAAVVPRLLDPALIPELGGRVLGEMPLHLLGHSRGGSLVCEMSRLLGERGVWVDQVTTWDARPLNNDGFNDRPFYTVTDATARIYENVLFADACHQTIDTVFFGVNPPGAFGRRLLNLDGGYAGIGGAHSDTHLWYHGTVDTSPAATDSQMPITVAMRSNWWSAVEGQGRFTGYWWSRTGGGNRLGTNQPAGAGTARVVDGYNKRWNLGVAGTNNRTLLVTNRGEWGNPVVFRTGATGVVTIGEIVPVSLKYQAARAGTGAVCRVFLDPDTNPWNGSGPVIGDQLFASTTATNMGSWDTVVSLAPERVAPGRWYVGVSLTVSNRTRYLYQREALTVVEPPVLALVRTIPGQGDLIVSGAAGQRVVLEQSAGLTGWVAVETNVLGGTPWRKAIQISEGNRFHRLRTDR